MLESISDETDTLLYIGTNLRKIKQCDDLIKQTTKLDNSKEKILCNTLDYSDQLLSSLVKMHDKCLIEKDLCKNNVSLNRILSC